MSGRAAPPRGPIPMTASFWSGNESIRVQCELMSAREFAMRANLWMSASFASIFSERDGRGGVFSKSWNEPMMRIWCLRASLIRSVSGGKSRSSMSMREA